MQGKWHSSSSGPSSAVWHDAGMQPDGDGGPHCRSADLPSRPDGAALHHTGISVVGGSHCCTLPAGQWVPVFLQLVCSRTLTHGFMMKTLSILLCNQLRTWYHSDTERKKSRCCRATGGTGGLNWLTVQHWRSASEGKYCRKNLWKLSDTSKRQHASCFEFIIFWKWLLDNIFTKCKSKSMVNVDNVGEMWK